MRENENHFDRIFRHASRSEYSMERVKSFALLHRLIPAPSNHWQSYGRHDKAYIRKN